MPELENDRIRLASSDNVRDERNKVGIIQHKTLCAQQHQHQHPWMNKRAVGNWIQLLRQNSKMESFQVEICHKCPDQVFPCNFSLNKFDVFVSMISRWRTDALCKYFHDCLSSICSLVERIILLPFRNSHVKLWEWCGLTVWFTTISVWKLMTRIGVWCLTHQIVCDPLEQQVLSSEHFSMEIPVREMSSWTWRFPWLNRVNSIRFVFYFISIRRSFFWVHFCHGNTNSRPFGVPSHWKHFALCICSAGASVAMLFSHLFHKHCIDLSFVVAEFLRYSLFRSEFWQYSNELFAFEAFCVENISFCHSILVNFDSKGAFMLGFSNYSFWNRWFIEKNASRVIEMDSIESPGICFSCSPFLPLSPFRRNFAGTTPLHCINSLKPIALNGRSIAISRNIVGGSLNAPKTAKLQRANCGHNSLDRSIQMDDHKRKHNKVPNGCSHCGVSPAPEDATLSFD